MGKKYLEESLQSELEKGNKLFIPYVMAGDGGLEQFISTLKVLEKCGASAIEIGIPFSDPVADGPTIQEAGKRALQNGTNLKQVFESLREKRQEIGIPIVFMTYMNPIYKYGIEHFFQECNEVGVDGVIIPDLPVEHRDLISKSTEKHEIAIIQLATLTSSIQRIKELGESTEGFLYAVTINGITGARSGFDNNIGTHLQTLKKNSTVPVLAGFGISTPHHVKEMTKYCDGVIVGSKIIDLLQSEDVNEIKELIDATKLITVDK